MINEFFLNFLVGSNPITNALSPVLQLPTLAMKNGILPWSAISPPICPAKKKCSSTLSAVQTVHKLSIRMHMLIY